MQLAVSMPLLWSQSARPDMPDGKRVVLTSIGPFSPLVFLFQPSLQAEQANQSFSGAGLCMPEAGRLAPSRLK
jgi:hypothetical protein